VPRLAVSSSALALLAFYFLMRVAVGFWWALGLTVAAALMIALVRFGVALTRAATSPPPRPPPPRE
jgi:hypothetical protein